MSRSSSSWSGGGSPWSGNIIELYTVTFTFLVEAEAIDDAGDFVGEIGLGDRVLLDFWGYSDIQNYIYICIFM